MFSFPFCTCRFFMQETKFRLSIFPLLIVLPYGSFSAKPYWAVSMCASPAYPAPLDQATLLFSSYRDLSSLQSGKGAFYYFHGITQAARGVLQISTASGL